MAVPTSITDLSETANSNFPQDGDATGATVASLPRNLSAIIKKMVAKGDDIDVASNGVVTIPDERSYFVFTGSGFSISGFSNAPYNGRRVTVRFNGAFTLTHSSAFLMPTLLNITTVSGEVADFIYHSTGVWECISYDAAVYRSIAAAASTLVALTTVQTITGKKLFAPTGTTQPGNVEIDVQTDQTGLYVDMAGATSNGILVDTDIATGNNLIQFRYTNSTPVQVGTITTNSTTTSYNTTSDYRLKDNVTPLTYYWDKVLALNPVQFTWKSNGHIDHGFIAHEVQEVIPNAVTGQKDGDDFQAMDAKFIIPFLVKAVQDLHSRVIELESLRVI